MSPVSVTGPVNETLPTVWTPDAKVIPSAAVIVTSPKLSPKPIPPLKTTVSVDPAVVPAFTVKFSALVSLILSSKVIAPPDEVTVKSLPLWR